MKPIEIKVRPSGSSQAITLIKEDVEVLLCLHKMTIFDLASNIGCARETLTRFLNGRGNFPLVQKKVEREVQRLLQELPRDSAWKFIRVA